MSLLDEIIDSRDHLYRVLEPLNIRWIRIYGSVLARKETVMSDVDLYVSFPEHTMGHECWEKCNEVRDALESILDRPIGVQCETHIFERFRETTERDSVDLRELEHTKSYPVTAKSSAIYFEMLRREVEQWNEFYSSFSQGQHTEWNCNTHLDKDSVSHLLAKSRVIMFLHRSSRWFSRLMRLKDNDILEQTDFDLFGLIILSHEAEENTVEWQCDNNRESLVQDIQFINRCIPELTKWIKRYGY